jgi:chorismate synthase
MRFLTAGESHGPQLTAIVEGLPSQLELGVHDIDPWLALRQSGYGRGRRMQIETDQVQIMSGVRSGKTTGAPVALVVPNKDYRNWIEIMNPEDDGVTRKKALTKARPGHADLAGGIKYGHKDLRDVLERASARETTMRVATGAIALKMLADVGVQGINFVQSMLDIESQVEFSWDALGAVENSLVRCPDPEASARIVAAVDQAKKDGDTIGGVLEIRFRGLPVGLGSSMHWDRKLDGRIAAAVMGTQAVKGVEIGHGFATTRVPGSKVHDAIYRNEHRGYFRVSNGAGGLEAGMTNGEELIVRAALKPIATLMTPLPTVDVVSKEPADAARERSDTTAVPAAGVILQCVIGWVLAEALLEKFGGDTMPEIQQRVEAYRKYTLEY